MMYTASLLRIARLIVPREYFITARSFAAPFCSDESERYVEAETPKKALEKFASEYSHPAGLYAAECWTDANAYHKRQEPLARWESYDLQGEKLAIGDKHAYVRERREDGNVYIDGKAVVVGKPKDGSIV